MFRQDYTPMTKAIIPWDVQPTIVWTLCTPVVKDIILPCKGHYIPLYQAIFPWGCSQPTIMWRCT